VGVPRSPFAVRATLLVTGRYLAFVHHQPGLVLIQLNQKFGSFDACVQKRGIYPERLGRPGQYVDGAGDHFQHRPVVCVGPGKDERGLLVQSEHALVAEP
jgi:hypothetical protein